MAKPVGLIPNYTDQYIETCFFLWYDKNRGRGKFSINHGFPPSDDGNTPSVNTVQTWRKKYDWDARAEAMDAEVSRKLEQEAIQKKVEMLKKVSDMVEIGADKAMQYIEKEGFDSSAAAVRMLLGGSEFLAKFAGAGELLQVVKNMSDQQLTRELNKLLGKQDDADIDITAEDVDEHSDSEDS